MIIKSLTKKSNKKIIDYQNTVFSYSKDRKVLSIRFDTIDTKYLDTIEIKNYNLKNHWIYHHELSNELCYEGDEHSEIPVIYFMIEHRRDDESRKTTYRFHILPTTEEDYKWFNLFHHSSKVQERCSHDITHKITALKDDYQIDFVTYNL